MRSLLTLTFGILIITAGCNTPSDAESPVPVTETPVEDSAVSTPSESSSASTASQSQSNRSAFEDPENDMLGWENGYWYNESITVDRSDGLNQTELNATVARAMARVEEIRELEFKNSVPVEVVSRTEFRNQTAKQFGNTDPRFRVHQNAKFEALFFVNESTDAIAVQQQTRAGSVLGYYSYASDEIVIVSDNTSSPSIDEITLSQELFHALQDQYFNLSSEILTGNTIEEDNAVSGVIEGDGNYVDYLYEQRCDAEWDCLRPQSTEQGGDGVNIGMNVLQLPPYTEGVEFVKRVKQRDGWSGVNELYQNPPQSTEQYIYPGKYPDEPVASASIDDRSTSEWQVLELGQGSVNYARFGEAGLFTMFWYASYEETVQRGTQTTVVVPYTSLFVPGESEGELAEPNPYNYSHPVTDGYAGDRFLPYVSDSTPRNETGYVWRTEWDSTDDAREFAEAYRELLKYHDAERVRENTYVIQDGEFNDAFQIEITGSSVVIVNAPAVSDLNKIREQ